MDTRFLQLFGGEDLFKTSCPRLYDALAAGVEPSPATDDLLPISIMANILPQKPAKVQISYHFSEAQVCVIVRTDIWNNDKNEKLGTYFSQAESCYTHTVEYTLEKTVETPALRVETYAMWLTKEEDCHTGEAVTYSSKITEESKDLIGDITVTKPQAKDNICTKIGYLGRHGSTMDYVYDVYPVSGKLCAMLPFEGRITFQENWIPVEIIIDKPLLGPSPSLKLVIEKSGTVDYYPELGARGFFERLRIENNEVVWSLGDDNWHSNINIININIQMVATLHSVFTVKVQKVDQPDYFQYMIVHVDSHPLSDKQNVFNSIAEVDINPIQILWGCVAKGTQVEMADGSQKAIDTLQRGEVVRTHHGLSASVSDIICGMEETLVRISTDSGAEISLTKDHPVLTSRGLLKAECLNAGDILILREGETAIRYLYPTEYSDMVYNLVLDPPSLIILNGIVCGDFEHQNIHMFSLETAILSEKAESMMEEMKQLFKRLLNSEID